MPIRYAPKITSPNRLGLYELLDLELAFLAFWELGLTIWLHSKHVQIRVHSKKTIILLASKDLAFDIILIDKLREDSLINKVYKVLKIFELLIVDLRFVDKFDFGNVID